MSQRLWQASDVPAIAKITVASIGSALGAKAALLIPAGNTFRVAADHPKGTRLSREELNTAIHWQENNFRRMGERADGDKLTCTLLPLNGASKKAAIIIVGATTRRRWRLPDRKRAIDLFAGHAAAALERVALAEAVEKVRIASETEKLRSALLASISHDLKEPLSIIFGSASSGDKARIVAGASPETKHALDAL